MPLSLGTVDQETGALKMREWPLKGEMDADVYTARFTSNGIAPGYRHTCSVNLDRYLSRDEMEQVFDRLALYFKDRDTAKDTYFVHASMNGYIGVFFSSLCEQNSFISAMARGVPDCALRFVPDMDAWAQNEKIGELRANSGLKTVFAKEIVKELPPVKKIVRVHAISVPSHSVAPA